MFRSTQPTGRERKGLEYTGNELPYYERVLDDALGFTGKDSVSDQQSTISRDRNQDYRLIDF